MLLFSFEFEPAWPAQARRVPLFPSPPSPPQPAMFQLILFGLVAFVAYVAYKHIASQPGSVPKGTYTVSRSAEPTRIAQTQQPTAWRLRQQRRAAMTTRTIRGEAASATPGRNDGGTDGRAAAADATAAPPQRLWITRERDGGGGESVARWRITEGDQAETRNWISGSESDGARDGSSSARMPLTRRHSAFCSVRVVLRPLTGQAQ